MTSLSIIVAVVGVILTYLELKKANSPNICIYFHGEVDLGIWLVVANKSKNVANDFSLKLNKTVKRTGNENLNDHHLFKNKLYLGPDEERYIIYAGPDDLKNKNVTEKFTVKVNDGSISSDFCLKKNILSLDMIIGTSPKPNPIYTILRDIKNKNLRNIEGDCKYNLEHNSMKRSI